MGNGAQNSLNGSLRVPMSSQSSCELPRANFLNYSNSSIISHLIPLTNSNLSGKLDGYSKKGAHLMHMVYTLNTITRIRISPLAGVSGDAVVPCISAPIG